MTGTKASRQAIRISANIQTSDIQSAYEVYEVFDDAKIIAYVQTSFTPDEVFGDRALINWAIRKGHALPPDTTSAADSEAKP